MWATMCAPLTWLCDCNTSIPQTYIPLATVLLAISEQTFFLNNWHIFLAQNILPSLNKVW